MTEPALPAQRRRVVTEQALRAQRRRALLDEREQLLRLRDRAAPRRARRTRAQLVQRLNRLAI